LVCFTIFSFSFNAVRCGVWDDEIRFQHFVFVFLLMRWDDEIK